jgi:polygalacturonase
MRLFLLPLLLILPCAGGASWRTCDVTEFGAVGDGKTQNILSIRAALAACAGGGRVLFPAGVFIGAPFNVSSNTVLDVRGVLVGTNNLSLIPRLAPFPSMGGNITRDGHPCRFAPLVGAVNATNVTITGGGTIDGAGQWWWDNRDHFDVELPRLVELQHVDGLEVHHITLTNSPFWTVHPIYSRNLWFHDLTIEAEGKGRLGQNTDGIDPDSCEHVLIEDYTYCAGDDAVAIKSGWNWAGIEYNRPSRNITVRRATSGCRGGFTIGSEMSGGVQDVLFENCVSTGESGIRISSELGRGGYVKDVVFRNISFSWGENYHDHKQFLLDINQDYKPDNTNNTLSFFSNLTFEGLRVTKAPPGMRMGYITCLAQSACTGIVLSNITANEKAVPDPVPIACAHVASGARSNVDTALVDKGCIAGFGAG